MAKYPKLTGEIETALLQINTVAGRLEALGNILGELDNESVAEGLLTGDFKVEVVEGQVVIQRGIPLLFDRHPCRIRPRNLAANICNPNWNFHLDRIALDHYERLARMEEYCGTGNVISVSEFQERTEAGHAKAMALPGCANLAKAVRLPLCLSRAEIHDLGQALDELYLPTVEQSYKAQFPQRSFTNCLHGQLAKQVSIVSGSHYETLLQALSRGTVVANYYPNTLQGYSVHAQREQMATLPEGFILSGPLDTAMGWVMYPDVLGRDYKTPGYDCSAVQWQSSARSLCFGACVGEADFGRRANLSDACGRYSGGLLFLG
ncbi:MAG: hypothetical protein AAB880_00720 [Patescibacteria group bacterium]